MQDKSRREISRFKVSIIIIIRKDRFTFLQFLFDHALFRGGHVVHYRRRGHGARHERRDEHRDPGHGLCLGSRPVRHLDPRRPVPGPRPPGRGGVPLRVGAPLFEELDVSAAEGAVLPLGEGAGGVGGGGELGVALSRGAA